MRNFSIVARSAVAAAVSTISLLGAVSAQAATFAAPTSGIFTFDAGILGLLANATIAATGDGTFVGATKTNIFTGAKTYTSAVVTMKLPNVSLSSASAADLVASGAGLTGFTVTTKDNLVLSFSDISYSNADKSISSTIAANGTVLFSGAALSAASATVSENFDAATGKGLLTTAPLFLTDGAAAAFADAFGLSASLLPTVQGTKFGALTVDVTAAAAVTPSIPEPSTYALMGLGLVGIALASRKRAA
jgi:hypothetical protein